MTTRSRFAVILCAAAVALCAVHASDAGAQEVPVSDWLVLGPAPVGGPALGDTLPLSGTELASSRVRPAAGAAARWIGGRDLRWRREAATDDGRLVLPGGESAAVAYAATYLVADRWQEVRLVVETDGPRTVWLDGDPVEPGLVTLTQGTHLLLVGAARAGGAASGAPWRVSASVEPVTPGARLSPSLDPRWTLSAADLDRVRTVGDVALDPAGRRMALVVRGVDEQNDRWTTHIEVRDALNGELRDELRFGGGATSPRWSRDGRRLTFLAPTDHDDGRGRDLWVWTPGDRGVERLLRDVPGLSSPQWSADGNWILFTATADGDDDGADAGGDREPRRLTEVWHRWSSWPDRASLYALDVEQGTRVKLVGDTASSVVGATPSPDGGRVVFTRNVRIAERPFLRSELWVLELDDLRPRKLLDLEREVFQGPSTFAWSPDGRAVAFCASGRERLDGADPTFSAYDNELYAVPLERPRLVHLSGGFAPQVGTGLGCPELEWSPEDGRIYVGVEDGARTVPGRTTRPVPGALDDAFEGATLETLPLPGEVMAAHDFAGGALVAAVETPVTPPAVYRIDLADGGTTRLADPSADALDGVAMPAWEPWDFEDSDGWTIEGWYWTPPDFEPERSYPLIVFYYGGTLAEKKSFTPRLLRYAAQGYVVYVLNPAGAPGYGQDFSNLHIDDWGYPAASDILEGVERFIAEHRFVDPDRVGNFGHSYGGFMTMHLLTRSDRFAASVSLAGISNITNYWGAGWTGYSYTDGTCPGCYPWNRPDVFVERSPIFQADRIRTPLLLLHGTADTNVVPTESEQMFTALRMLDREVELVRFPGENHGIGSRPSVRRLRDTMILEWFDRHLRDRPAAWAARWGETDAAATAAAAASARH